MYPKSVIVVQDASPNEDDMKIFHTRFEISNSVIEIFMRPLRPSSEPYLREVGVPGKYLVRELMSLDGVTEVCIQPYEISIHISPSYSFDEVTPQVLEMLKMYTPENMLEEREFVSYVTWRGELKKENKASKKKADWFKDIFSKTSNWFKNIFK